MITKIEKTPLTAKLLRVAAYCRVSTDYMDQLESLETQVAHYEQYIRSHADWAYGGVFFDEGISGTKMQNRDGLNAMLADCEAGKIDMVITKSISRLCRNITDCLWIVRKLVNLGIPIYFEKENLKTGTGESELILSILSCLAESESRSISENVKWTVQKKFQDGSYVIGTPAYGYRNNKDGQLEIDPEEAKVVEMVYDAYLSGMSAADIVRMLNRSEVPSARGEGWSARSVQTIIRSEIYRGDMLFQKKYTDEHFNRHINHGERTSYYIEEHHEEIVPRAKQEKALAILRRNGEEKGVHEGDRKYLNRYCFSGKIICGECGGTFKRRIHYRNQAAWCCSGHLRDKNSCGMKYITDEALKEAYLRLLNKLASVWQTVLRPLQLNLKRLSECSSGEMPDLAKRREANFHERKVLSDRLSDGEINMGEFMSEMDRLKAEDERIKNVYKNRFTCEETGKKNKESLDKLVKLVSAGGFMVFREDLFSEYADSITVLTRDEVVFNLKCGLCLKEKL